MALRLTPGASQWKRLRTIILTLGMVVATEALGDTIGKQYKEDCDDFSLFIDGNSFDSDDSHAIAEGPDWPQSADITENAATVGDDELTIKGKALHNCRPHGEVDAGPSFKYDFFGDAGNYTRGVRSYLPKHSMVKRHNQHYDGYVAKVSILVDSTGSPDITDWDLDVTGVHSEGEPVLCDARMSGQQEVPANPSRAEASGTVILDPVRGTVTVSVLVSGITLAQLTAAHIHAAPPGVNGPVIVSLGLPSEWQEIHNGEGITRTVSNLPFPASQMQALRTGGTYLNVHTQTFPGGEIRGQLIPLAPCTGDEVYKAKYTGPGTVKVTGKQHVPGQQIEVRLFDSFGNQEQSQTVTPSGSGKFKTQFHGVLCVNKPHRVETDCFGADVKKPENCP